MDSNRSRHLGDAADGVLDVARRDHHEVGELVDDDEEEAKPATDALIARLTEITDLAARSIAPPTTVATSPDDFDGLDLEGIAATSPSIPRKLGTPSTELPNKDTPLNEKLCVRVTLTNLGWDRTAESLHLPLLTENGEWIYRSTD